MPGLKPSQMVAGGAVPDGKYRFTKSRFTVWDYDGQSGPQAVTFCAEVTLRALEDGTEYVQRWSAGDPKNFQPSDDGMLAVPVGAMAELRSGTNLWELMTSLVKAGYPEDRIDDSIGVTLDGLLADVTWKDVPRGGLQPNPRQLAQAQQTGQVVTGNVSRVLIATNIVELPWEATEDIAALNAAAPNPAPQNVPPSQRTAPQAPAAPRPQAAPAAAKAQTPATAPAAAATQSSPEVEAKTKEFVIGKLTEAAESGIDRRSMIAAAFATYSTDPDKGKIVGLINSQAFWDQLAVEQGDALVVDGTSYMLLVAA